MSLRRFLTEPFRLRTWRETAYALLAFPLGLASFVVFLTLLTTSLSLLIMVVGLPLLALTLWLARAAARGQREVVGTLLGVRIPGRAAVPVPADWPWWRRMLEPVLDLSTWRSLAYLLLLSFPVGLGLFITAVVLWSVALSFVTAPVWYWAVPTENRGDVFWGSELDASWEWLVVAGGGLLLVLIAPWILRALVALDVLLVRALLGPTRGELERAAARLAEQRDLAVASASGDRRQIERDLHDGAQARLVSLAVDLGRARRRLEEGGSTEEAAELVRGAHEDAKLALAEIRDLARGIHPAVLTDRGLDAALSSLAARSPVPVALSAEIGPRPPEPVESAAYFVVAEALTNVTRHSGAAHAAVSVAREDGALVVEVRDDGAGGAKAGPGSGLSGLRDRVGALGGTLAVDSPSGGPTSIKAVLPCAS